MELVLLDRTLIEGCSGVVGNDDGGRVKREWKLNQTRRAKANVHECNSPCDRFVTGSTITRTFTFMNIRVTGHLSPTCY